MKVDRLCEKCKSGRMVLKEIKRDKALYVCNWCEYEIVKELRK